MLLIIGRVRLLTERIARSGGGRGGEGGRGMWRGGRHEVTRLLPLLVALLLGLGEVSFSRHGGREVVVHGQTGTGRTRMKDEG